LTIQGYCTIIITSLAQWQNCELTPSRKSKPSTGSFKPGNLLFHLISRLQQATATSSTLTRTRPFTWRRRKVRGAAGRHSKRAHRSAIVRQHSV
jgi:hypothetical protein